MKVLFLGTGTSTGVPTVGCSCKVCSSDSPQNKRNRSSLLVEEKGFTLLIDAGPEFRIQCLTYGVRALDAVFLTHSHADHILGLDDLRPFSYQKPLALYADEPTLDHLHATFPYFFAEEYSEASRPNFDVRLLQGEPVQAGPLTVLPVPIFHGKKSILGFRIGGMAYLTDCSGIPESSLALLRGVKVLILDALRYKYHPTHFNLASAIEAARSIGSPSTWFTHISHDLDHETVNRELPSGMRLAHDGLRLEVE